LSGLFLAAAIIQGSVLPIFFSSGRIPNIILALVLVVAISAGFDDYLFWILAAGILFDLVSFQRFGVSAFFLVAVSYLASFFSRRFPMESRNWGFLLAAFFMLIASVFYNFLITYSAVPFLSFRSLMIFSNSLLNINFLFQASYNILFFILFYFIYEKLNNKSRLYNEAVYSKK
jgi:rod shape-determining protein MreD